VVPFAETLYRGGEGWYRQRNLEHAASQLRQALTVNPNHLKARLLLGQVLIEQEQPDAAIAELEEAYQYDADAARYPLVRALLDKAQRLERDKQPDTALELYERVLKLSPREPVAHERHDAIWIAHGDTALQAHEFDNAIAAYEKAGAQDKVDRATQLKRRQQYERMVQIAQQHEEHEEWPQALTLYQQLTDKFPAETGRSI
jgi:tetratricopeptide (TPR) repeat protein